MPDAVPQQSQLERLLSLGPGLAEGLDLETVLRRVVDGAREVTGARYAALGVLDPSGQALERFITAGLSDEEIARIGDLPRGRGVLGELIRNPRPLRLDDVTRHPRSYGVPVGHPPMHSFLGVPIRVKGNVYGNLYLTEKQGGPFDEADEAAALRLADWAGMSIENARLHDALRARHSELKRTVEVLETNVEIARALGAATELDPILELIVKRARALVEARAVAVAVIRGDEFVVTHTAGALETDLTGYRIPWDRDVASFGRGGRPVPRDLEDALARAAGADASLVVPMVFRDWPLGAIAAFDRAAGPSFGDDDRRLLESFAASASIAVASAQRATKRALRQSIEASERERARWARELHDETLQDIGALRVLLSAARNSGDPAALAAAVDDAIERLGDMGGALRDLISDLRPAVLDQLGLTPALEAMLARATRDTGLDIGLHVGLGVAGGPAPERLAPELELAVYRVVQEAVTNAVKHAGATRVEVGVVEGDGAIDVSVRDDGRGFDPGAAHAGFGLTGVRERVEQHGGALQVASGPGRGTVVDVTLPVRRAAPAPAAPAAPR
jgi:signal transduction histidine kinase